MATGVMYSLYICMQKKCKCIPAVRLGARIPILTCWRLCHLKNRNPTTCMSLSCFGIIPVSTSLYILVSYRQQIFRGEQSLSEYLLLGAEESVSALLHSTVWPRANPSSHFNIMFDSINQDGVDTGRNSSLWYTHKK